jgi:hypothetical protein
MILQKLSQILAVAGIFASQEEKILTAVKNIPELQEVIKNHEPHLEAPLDHPCQFTEDIRQLWATSDGEKK